VEKSLCDWEREMARKEAVNLKDIYLDFLLVLNEDFYDNLLQEVIELLVDH
jgi:hypothetical protein